MQDICTDNNPFTLFPSLSNFWGKEWGLISCFMFLFFLFLHRETFFYHTHGGLTLHAYIFALSMWKYMNQRPSQISRDVSMSHHLELWNAHESFHETTRVFASFDGVFVSMVPIGSFTSSFDLWERVWSIVNSIWNDIVGCIWNLID